MKFCRTRVSYHRLVYSHRHPSVQHGPLVYILSGLLVYKTRTQSILIPFLVLCHGKNTRRTDFRVVVGHLLSNDVHMRVMNDIEIVLRTILF